MSLFDRFACWASTTVARAPFFCGCLLICVLWLIQGAVRIATSGWSSFLDQTYQLEINTTTTVVTFLLVALLQNAQERGDKATQQKLNAIADFLATLADHEFGDATDAHVAELRRAVGLEGEVSA